METKQIKYRLSKNSLEIIEVEGNGEKIVLSLIASAEMIPAPDSNPWSMNTGHHEPVGRLLVRQGDAYRPVDFEQTKVIS